MVSSKVQVIEMLKAEFSFSIRSDTVPEGTILPTIVVTEIANTSNRVIDGTKYGVKYDWRVTVYVNNEDDLDPILEKLEELDNTSNTFFQRVFTQYVLTEPKRQGQSYTRAFFDLNLTK